MPEQTYKNIEGAQRVYINSVQIGSTTFDFRLLMGTIESASEDAIVTNVTHVIFMSPQHAKVFADILDKNVKAYEALHGELKLNRDGTPKDETSAS